MPRFLQRVEIQWELIKSNCSEWPEPILEPNRASRDLTGGVDTAVFQSTILEHFQIRHANSQPMLSHRNQVGCFLIYPFPLSQLGVYFGSTIGSQTGAFAIWGMQMWLGNGIILSKPALVKLYFDIGYKQLSVLFSFLSIHKRDTITETK